MNNEDSKKLEEMIWRYGAVDILKRVHEEIAPHSSQAASEIEQAIRLLEILSNKLNGGNS